MSQVLSSARTARGKGDQRWKRISVYLGVVVLVLAIWELLSATGAVAPLLLASPQRTWTALGVLAGNGHTLAHPVLITLRDTATAFAIAAVLAVPLGALVGSMPVLRRAYEPLFTSLSALPLVILYPVLAATLGIGSGSKIALGAIYAFFPMVIATVRAAAGVDRGLLTAATTMGARRSQRLRSVVAPAILLAVVASMRVALGLALVTIIAGEFISGAEGIGYELGAASQLLDTPTLFAWIVIACALTVLVNLVFALFSSVTQKGIYR